jgi:hypothetical protein
MLAYGIDMEVFLSVFKSGLSGPIITNVLAKFVAGIFVFITHIKFAFLFSNRLAMRHQAIRYLERFVFAGKQGFPVRRNCTGVDV